MGATACGLEQKFALMILGKGTSSVRVEGTAVIAKRVAGALGPSPFAAPAKRQRRSEPEAYCVSTEKTCLDYEYCYHEYHDLADPRWDCEICGAHFLLIGTSERCRQGLGVVEVGYHDGGVGCLA